MNFHSAEFVKGAVRQDDLPVDGLPEVAFSGRSNVGKSALINRLLGRRKLARTSSTPGKTQQLNYYRIDQHFYLVDLPGYGFVRGGMGLRTRLGELTERYLENRNVLRAIIQLIDARHGPTALDWLMIEWLRACQKPFLLVFTKIDKASRSQLGRQFERLETSGELAGLAYAPFSALTGEGRDPILAWMLEAIGMAVPEERCIAAAGR